MSEETVSVNIRDINPLEHITSDIAKSRLNYEAILNGLVTWNTTDSKVVTVRLATDSYPYFVDYTFPSRRGIMGGGNTFGTAGMNDTIFDYEHMLGMVSMQDDVDTLRLNVTGGSGNWKLYEMAIVFDEESIGSPATRNYYRGDYIRALDSRIIYVAKAPISKDDAFTTATNVEPAIVKWNINNVDVYNSVTGLVTFLTGTNESGSFITDCYVGTGAAFSRRTPNQETSGWEWLAQSIGMKTPGTMFSKGMLYLYAAKSDFSDAALYMYIGDPEQKTENTDLVPVDTNGNLNADHWYGPVMLRPVTAFSSSILVHNAPHSAIEGYILRSESYAAGQVTVVGNVAVREGTSEPHRGLSVFRSCNYVQWPDNVSSMWLPGNDYSGSTARTAKMVFHHASDDCKMCNIINYDGPDVDDGLSIYLPAEDLITGDNGEPAYIEAQDGAMFEFMFRIWPNTSYNGATTPDLIINKAQIYVHTVARSDDLDGASIVAKFSMARLTNFYLWAENVAVPNRPVFYKAKFIYSRETGQWKTYDYYQIPDHVFLSPKGFVDPAIRNSAEGDSYGENGPFSGVQTAGFPLMQDPFGGLDLGPIRMNRIERDD